MKLWKAEILLGTNLGNREENLSMAKNYITQQVGKIIFESRVLETEPVGFTSDDLFLNQYICIQTTLSPIKLLDKLKSIEKKMGRVYEEPKEGEKYCSRIIDLDILNYDDIVCNSSKLTLPHHQISSRSFVKTLMSKEKS